MEVKTDMELPDPSFRLTWRDGAYRVSKPNIAETDCYTADQLREHGESCSRMAREEAAKERRDLEEVLATIAAQSSGIPASTSRADCMAALAAAAIRKG